ncbi:polysaccharide deacetylase family protein [Paenibacillus taichungensis]|uniref:polysaccharide deacetylase family protein n=1 Tax=Paenibacillus taichungensis TaxID=484184 RepID=UPI0035DD6812
MRFATRPKNRRYDKIAYLTFDDGPSKYTNQILDILKRHNIKATFFVLGNTSSYGLKMYRKMKRLGHSIGNHTYSHHFNRIYRSPKAFFADFYRMERLLQRVIGIRARLFRFPGGSNTKRGSITGGSRTMDSIKKELCSRGYLYCDWTIDSLDSSIPWPTPKQIIAKVLQESRFQHKCIILFHDFSDCGVLALSAVIRGLKKQGYRFDRLSTRSYNYQIKEGGS